MSAIFEPDDVTRWWKTAAATSVCARLKEAMENAVAQRRDFRVEYRTLRPGGRTSWIEMRGRVLEDDGTRVVGVCADPAGEGGLQLVVAADLGRAFAPTAPRGTPVSLMPR